MRFEIIEVWDDKTNKYIEVIRFQPDSYSERKVILDKYPMEADMKTPKFTAKLCNFGRDGNFNLQWGFELQESYL